MSTRHQSNMQVFNYFSQKLQKDNLNIIINYTKKQPSLHAIYFVQDIFFIFLCCLFLAYVQVINVVSVVFTPRHCGLRRQPIVLSAASGMLMSCKLSKERSMGQGRSQGVVSSDVFPVIKQISGLRSRSQRLTQRLGPRYLALLNGPLGQPLNVRLKICISQ